MSVQHAQVVIVGGGPVGMGLAIDLALKGISSLVVERYLQPQPIPKGQNLTQRTMEHFWFWGVEDDVRAASPIPLEFGIGGATAYGSLLSDYNYDWYQRALVRPYYFKDNERLPQSATEAALRVRAAMGEGWLRTVRMTSTCLPHSYARYSAVVSAMRGVMMRSMVGSLARLRNSVTRSCG
jgi:hypothetical protein